MEISDLRKADAAKKLAKAKADQYVASVPSSIPALSPSPAIEAPSITYCASCKHWERQDEKTVFAACGLSRHSGLPVAMATTDKTTCGKAEKR